MNDLIKDFPLIENKKITYLDSGATTQKPIQVINAIEEFYKNYNANPHRGAYSLSMEATEIYENTRTKIAKFINAKHREEIIFSKNATESLNLIAYSYGLEKLHKDDEIVISIMEHHSNLVPWQKVANKTGAKLNYMYINDDFELSDEEIESKITDKTKIVGLGILYGKKEILNDMTPFLMGGDMIEYVHEQTTTFAPLPNKFEAGTQNVEAVIGLGAAIDYIENIGYDKINQIEKEVVDYAREELSKLDFITLYLTPNNKNHSSVISFNIKGIHPHDVASILDSCGVCVRSGNHCAQPLMRFLGIDSTCRASFYLYNTKEDVDKLVDSLKKAYNMFEKYLPKKSL